MGSLVSNAGAERKERTTWDLPPGTPLIARLWHKSVYMPSRCYEWRGVKNSDGYGHLNVDGRYERTHRAAYKLLVGPIPDGLQLDHLCRNRACWNPQHLEPVTSRENTMRSNQSLASANAKKTHCKRGHELAGANLILRPGHRPGVIRRACRACKRISDRANEARRSTERTEP